MRKLMGCSSACWAREEKAKGIEVLVMVSVMVLYSVRVYFLLFTAFFN